MFGFYGFAQAPFAFISVVYGAIVNVESSDVNTTTGSDTFDGGQITLYYE